MQYVSTRGLAPPQSFLQIVLDGLASDGGLYLPAHYPKISIDTLTQWQSLAYPELALAVMSLYIDDIPQPALAQLLQQTYRAEVFCHSQSANADPRAITPLVSLGTENGTPLYLLELSNGPTLAFKDIALQFVGQLFGYALAQHPGRQLNILGATSGDTGSAAEYAVKGKPGIRIFMLSPHEKMSTFQSAQMFSLQEANVTNWTVPGFFDDCQNLVKAVSNDLAFKQQYQIGTVNSINWARVLAQVVYYFYAYLRATSRIGAPVSFAVPSGNFGNICAGHVARMMGLPVQQLVLATNENDILDECIRTGVYRVRASAQETSSPSMDIAKASNFERFIFDLSGRDATQLRRLFAAIEQSGQFDLKAERDASGRELFAQLASYGLVSGHSTHDNRLQTIQDTVARYQRIIDPHTADALKVARQYLQPAVPMVVLETAQPAKFNTTIRAALGQDAPRPTVMHSIEQLPQRKTLIENDVLRLKQRLQAAITGGN